MSIAVIGNGAIANLVCWLSHQNLLECVNYVRENSDPQLVCQMLSGDEVVLDRKMIKLVDVHAKQIDQPLVFLPLKAYQIIPALKQYSNSFDGKSTIVLLHNGMIDLDKVKQLIPDNPIVAATTSNGAFKPQVNKLCITGIGPTQAGWVRKATKAEGIETQLNQLLSPCEWSNDIQQILWRKLAVNAVINPLTALYDVNNGELARPQFQKEIMAITNEVTAIMNQLGYQTDCHQLIKNVAGA